MYKLEGSCAKQKVMKESGLRQGGNEHLFCTSFQKTRQMTTLEWSKVYLAIKTKSASI